MRVGSHAMLQRTFQALQTNKINVLFISISTMFVIWKEHARVSFSRTIKIARECNLKSLKNSLVYVFSRETILLLINNIHS
jgi:hypothetical protein